MLLFIANHSCSPRKKFSYLNVKSKKMSLKFFYRHGTWLLKRNMIWRTEVMCRNRQGIDTNQTNLKTFQKLHKVFWVLPDFVGAIYVALDKFKYSPNKRTISLEKTKRLKQSFKKCFFFLKICLLNNLYT